MDKILDHDAFAIGWESVQKDLGRSSRNERNVVMWEMMREECIGFSAF